MRLLSALALAAALLGPTGCRSSSSEAGGAPAAKSPPTEAKEWYCPMDKEVVAPKPGTCPRCGMRLEPRK